MTDAAERVAKYVAASSEMEFLRQEITFDAVCMNLLWFGECARVLPADTRVRLPLTPWPDIINLRHRIAHGYDKLKPGLLWIVAAHDLPALARQVAELRKSL
jgi:uncharacterized protein with HEPN domain